MATKMTRAQYLRYKKRKKQQRRIILFLAGVAVCLLIVCGLVWAGVIGPKRGGDGPNTVTTSPTPKGATATPSPSPSPTPSPFRHGEGPDGPSPAAGEALLRQGVEQLIAVDVRAFVSHDRQPSSFFR